MYGNLVRYFILEELRKYSSYLDGFDNTSIMGSFSTDIDNPNYIIVELGGGTAENTSAYDFVRMGKTSQILLGTKSFKEYRDFDLFSFSGSDLKKEEVIIDTADGISKVFKIPEKDHPIEIQDLDVFIEGEKTNSILSKDYQGVFYLPDAVVFPGQDIRVVYSFMEYELPGYYFVTIGDESTYNIHFFKEHYKENIPVPTIRPCIKMMTGAANLEVYVEGSLMSDFYISDNTLYFTKNPRGADIQIYQDGALLQKGTDYFCYALENRIIQQSVLGFEKQFEISGIYPNAPIRLYSDFRSNIDIDSLNYTPNSVTVKIESQLLPGETLYASTYFKNTNSDWGLDTLFAPFRSPVPSLVAGSDMVTDANGHSVSNYTVEDEILYIDSLIENTYFNFYFREDAGEFSSGSYQEGDFYRDILRGSILKFPEGIKSGTQFVVLYLPHRLSSVKIYGGKSSFSVSIQIASLSEGETSRRRDFIYSMFLRNRETYLDKGLYIKQISYDTINNSEYMSVNAQPQFISNISLDIEVYWYRYDPVPDTIEGLDIKLFPIYKTALNDILNNQRR